MLKLFHSLIWLYSWKMSSPLLYLTFQTFTSNNRLVNHQETNHDPNAAPVPAVAVPLRRIVLPNPRAGSTSWVGTNEMRKCELHEHCTLHRGRYPDNNKSEWRHSCELCGKVCLVGFAWSLLGFHVYDCIYTVFIEYTPLYIVIFERLVHTLLPKHRLNLTLDQKVASRARFERHFDVCNNQKVLGPPADVKLERSRPSKPPARKKVKMEPVEEATLESVYQGVLKKITTSKLFLLFTLVLITMFNLLQYPTIYSIQPSIYIIQPYPNHQPPQNM